jgi:hypothetical protein
VCRYQNDGTETITPAKFIERARAQAVGWDDEIDASIAAFLAGGGDPALMAAARKIAADISRVCDRIRTGQLKASFQGKINNE